MAGKRNRVLMLPFVKRSCALPCRLIKILICNMLKPLRLIVGMELLRNSRRRHLNVIINRITNLKVFTIGELVLVRIMFVVRCRRTMVIRKLAIALKEVELLLFRRRWRTILFTFLKNAFLLKKNRIRCP